MHKLVITDINTHMRNQGPVKSKEYKIAVFYISVVDLPEIPIKFIGTYRQPGAIIITVYNVHQSGAIKPQFSRASTFIGCTKIPGYDLAHPSSIDARN
jgi:hypothetical protein